MENEFKIALCSDLDYEEMVADIHWGDKIIATVNQEGGIETMELEIFLEGDNSLKFPLDDFIKVLQKSKEYLTNSTKID